MVSPLRPRGWQSLESRTGPFRACEPHGAGGMAAIGDDEADGEIVTPSAQDLARYGPLGGPRCGSRFVHEMLLPEQSPFWKHGKERYSPTGALVLPSTCKSFRNEVSRGQHALGSPHSCFLKAVSLYIIHGDLSGEVFVLFSVFQQFF